MPNTLGHLGLIHMVGLQYLLRFGIPVVYIQTDAIIIDTINKNPSNAITY